MRISSPMTQNLIEDGQLNRSAAAEALRKFLEEIIRTAKLDLKIDVTTLRTGIAPDAGGAEVFADLSGRDAELRQFDGIDLGTGADGRDHSREQVRSRSARGDAAVHVDGDRRLRAALPIEAE